MNKQASKQASKIVPITLATALLFGLGAANAQNLSAAPAKKTVMSGLFLGSDIPGATDGDQGPLPGPKTCRAGATQSECIKTYIQNCSSGGGTTTGTNGGGGEVLTCDHEG